MGVEAAKVLVVLLTWSLVNGYNDTTTLWQCGHRVRKRILRVITRDSNDSCTYSSFIFFIRSTWIGTWIQPSRNFIWKNHFPKIFSCFLICFLPSNYGIWMGRPSSSSHHRHRFDSRWRIWCLRRSRQQRTAWTKASKNCGQRWTRRHRGEIGGEIGSGAGGFRLTDFLWQKACGILSRILWICRNQRWKRSSRPSI